MRPLFNPVAAPAWLLALVGGACIPEPSQAWADVVKPPAVSPVTNPAGRIEHLRREIARHDELYYRQARPEVSDAEYDALKAELIELERSLSAGDSPPSAPSVQDLGDDRLPQFAKHRHRERMLSLDKTTSESGLREFDRTLRRLVGSATAISFVVEPKIDGLAVSATYENGRLTCVATRGNGDEGDDVSAAARRIQGLPAALTEAPGAPVPRRVEVRGEVHLSFAESERINRVQVELGRPEFSSPRNLAAGTLKALNLAESEARQLDIVFYGLGGIEAAAAPAGQDELLDWLESWGLPVVDACRVPSIDAAWGAVQELGRRRAKLPYPIDGAVVKLDSTSGQRAAGASAYAPRWAIAFKFAPEHARTRLRGITLQVGRTGVITPVAELDPVQVAGALITRATLHNAEEIARRDIRVGDTVLIERQGEVIPGVVAVDRARREPGSIPFVFPVECPGCGARLWREPGEVTWRCRNAACPAQRQRRPRHFASGEGVAIRGLGEATVAALVQRGLVREIPDIYRLQREDLEQGLGMSGSSAQALVAAIERSKHPPLWRLINGLSLPGVGRVGAQSLGRKFGSLEALISASENEIAGVDGISAGAAGSVKHWLADHGSLITQLLAAGVTTRDDPGAERGCVEGKCFVLSGTLPTLSQRQAGELIEAAGGRISTSVTSETTYLIAGSGAGAKVRRAEALGVEIIDERQMLLLLNTPELTE